MAAESRTPGRAWRGNRFLRERAHDGRSAQERSVGQRARLEGLWKGPRWDSAAMGGIGFSSGRTRREKRSEATEVCRAAVALTTGVVVRRRQRPAPPRGAYKPGMGGRSLTRMAS